MSSGFGYPDWQRVESFDGALLLSDNGVVRTGTYVSPVFYVGNWQFLAGELAVAGNQALVTIDWGTSQAMTSLVGRQQFVISASIADPFDMRMPNLGPWCRLTFAPVTGATVYNQWASVFGSNRFYPNLTPIRRPALILDNAIAIGAGANYVRTPDCYFAGPAHLWVVVGQLFNVSLTAWTAAGTSKSFEEWVGNAANTDFHADINLPLGLWQITVANNSASASTVYIGLVPSFT